MADTQSSPTIRCRKMQSLAASFQVVQCQEITPGTIEVVCKNQSNFSFKPGQYVSVTLNELIYADPKGRTRKFNVVSSPNNKDYLGFAFAKSASGFKKTLSSIPVNSEIWIKGPFGVFTLPEDHTKPVVFVADGIGVTPCVSMALYAAEERLPHKITMIYTDQKAFPYLDGLREIEKENSNFKLFTKTGLADSNFIKKSVSDVKNSRWFVSGIPRSVSEMTKSIGRLGVFEKDIKIEEFSGY